MEVVKEWVENIFLFIIALTFVEMLLPDSNIKPYVKFIFSMAIMGSIIIPIFSLLE